MSRSTLRDQDTNLHRPYPLDLPAVHLADTLAHETSAQWPGHSCPELHNWDTNLHNPVPCKDIS